MKKVLIFSLMAAAMLATTGVALAATPNAPVAPIAATTATPAFVNMGRANPSNMMPTPGGQQSYGMPQNNQRMPMMHQGPGRNTLNRGGMNVRPQQNGIALAARMIVGGITLLLVWAIMALTVVGLWKWIKKQNR